MAEAVADRPPPPQRFYCHVCNVEIQMVTSDYTCPFCAGGFIEELPANSETSSEDVELPDANGVDNLDIIRDELRTLLMSRTGGPRPATESNLPDDDQQSGSTGVRGPSRRNRRHHRMPNADRFDNILLDILHTLSGGNEAALGNASMFFMGNPGDYAWGHEGIDTIVTQLLNQMDTTGPPPLPKEKIEEIPNVGITQEQVDLKLQCSVCWEDFKLNEFVRKLPCLHVYHENCIVPWLELHGTCPICRKSLTPEAADVTNSLRNVASAFIRSSSEDSAATHSSSNGLPQTNLSSSQPDLQQLPEHDSILNNFPLTFSRIFSQPGTSGMSSPATLTMVVEPADHYHTPNNSSGDGGGGGNIGGGLARGAGNSGSSRNGSSNTRTNNSSQNDIYKYDDGNVDFDFD